MAKSIQIKSGTANIAGDVADEDAIDPDELAKFFPTFMWVVRDFALRLLDNDGNKMTAKTYLENSLREQSGFSDAVASKNRIRRMIVSFFKERDCYTMVRPTEDERDIQRLQDLTNQDMRPEFVEQMEALRAKIFKRVKPKQINGQIITGEALLMLCEAYT